MCSWGRGLVDVCISFNGLTVLQMANRYNMVIVCPILERDEVHSGTLHNTAVVISNTGQFHSQSCV